MTPPTSLPGPPSSQAGENSRQRTPQYKKRKSGTWNNGRVCRSSPTSSSGIPPSSEADGNSLLGTARTKRHKSAVEDQQHIPRSPLRKRRGSSPVCQPKGSLQCQARREPLAEVVNASQPAILDTASSTSQPGPNLNEVWASPRFQPVPIQVPLELEPLAETSLAIPDVADPLVLPNQPSLCPLKGTKCPFHNRPILLSPSLASRKDITKTLLSLHGIHTYITDHAAWGPEDVDRPDTWKICLVDSEKTGETLRFLNGVEKRPLKTKNGREYIEAYDWRVLVWVGEAEKGKAKQRRDAFGRWFVGLV